MLTSGSSLTGWPRRQYCDHAVIVPRAEAAALLERARAAQDEETRRRVLAGESMYRLGGVDKLF